jgi:methylated-DNA-[protein]-cysteine S-methyltransferase
MSNERSPRLDCSMTMGMSGKRLLLCAGGAEQLIDGSASYRSPHDRLRDPPAGRALHAARARAGGRAAARRAADADDAAAVARAPAGDAADAARPGRFVLAATPIGDLFATADGGAVTGLWWNRAPTARASSAVLDRLDEELGEYFAGERVRFDVPVEPRGTPWQRAVWDALAGVEHGSTITYAELAARAGRPGAARAAGAANGRNPISILIPCHRVVGTGGALTGYAGGVDAKAWLIAHERAVRSRAPSTGSRAPRTTGRRVRPAA